MSNVPGGAQVARALKTVKREVKASLKLINQQAAKLLAKGNYESAQALVEVARSVAAYQTEVEVVQSRWKEVIGSGGGKARKDECTTQWEYYQPILRALVTRGGGAELSQLLVAVEREMGPVLKPGDLEVMQGGRPRWQVMVRRARRQMVKEGFVEDTGGPVWRITAGGKRAAAAKA